MLNDPENKVWYDDSQLVVTLSKSRADRLCTAIADRNERKGEGRCTFIDSIRSKSGRSYKCIFEREIEECPRN